MKPIVYDLYCGLGGWAEGFLSEGYQCIGFDIEPWPYPGTFRQQDVLTLNGADLKDATCIVASPPCQFFSYTAMPWKKAKALAIRTRNHSALLEKELALFNACFRIQREASEAAGRYIPMVVENVKGAQPWVGRAKWHFGSFYLWGDVPALMPIARSQKFNPDGTNHPPGSWFAIADSKNRGAKTSGQDWNRFNETGEVSPHWRMEAIKVPTFNFHQHEKTGKPGGSFQSASVKQGGDWFGRDGESIRPRLQGSKSPLRKLASAQIAKIPFPLAVHIARTFKEKSYDQMAASSSTASVF